MARYTLKLEKKRREDPTSLDHPIKLYLTVNEMITTQAAINVAKEAGAVTVEYADSVIYATDAAIDRWADV